MTHTGPAGRSGLIERFELYNQGVAGQGNSWAENIADAHQDWYKTATLLCLQWIIDDGVPSRGHRTNFFNTNALNVGIGIYPYTKNSKKRDRVTMFYAQSSVCKNCNTFTKEINDSVCWSNFAAN